MALAVLPWKYLLGQQMSKKEKIGATIAMSMGLLYVPDKTRLDVDPHFWSRADQHQPQVPGPPQPPRRRQSPRSLAPMRVSTALRGLYHLRRAADTQGKGEASR